METDELSTVVRAFLRAHIQSVSQIEILKLMFSAPRRAWTARGVNEVICFNEAAIKRRLLDFAKAGLIVENSSSPGAYECQNPESPLGAAVRETVEAYLTKPVRVIETIFKPEGDAAQRFADAFLIRPK